MRERGVRVARLLVVPLGSALVSLALVAGVLTLAGYRLVRESAGTAVTASAITATARAGVASAAATGGTATAGTPTGGILAVVTPARTGPTATATATVAPTATVVGTVIVSTALASTRYVVTRTGGVGVVFREAPSPTAPVIVLIMEDEEVTVTAPPIDANGYIWYPVQRNGRAGFIRGEYLTVARP